jgi:hypothetical protein
MRAPTRLLTAVLVTACAVAHAPVRADDTGDELEELLGGFEEEEVAPEPGTDDDDLLGGFDDEPTETDEIAGAAAEPSEDDSFWSWWDLGGRVTLANTFSYLNHGAPLSIGPRDPAAADLYDWDGLTKMRLKLGLELDGDLPGDWKIRLNGWGQYEFAYLINGRSNFTDQVLDQYEWFGDLQEGYIAGSLHEDFDIKLGRQVVNWGRSDSLRLLDILNPLDNREPGIADIEDLRLGVAMVRGDYYCGPFSISGLFIPEVRFSELPVYGSDFFPATPGGLPPTATSPDPDGFEYAGAVNGIFRGWDFSVNVAYYYEDIAFLDAALNQLLHDRLLLVGGGGNYTWGSWLFKTEGAWIDGFEYGNLPGVDAESRWDFMFGIEYYGINNWNFALEILNRHINDYDPVLQNLGLRKNSMETAARITANFLNERLEVTLLGVVLGPTAEDGSIVRVDAAYELRDALELRGGFVFYQDGDNLTFQNIGRNDRIFFDISYSF